MSIESLMLDAGDSDSSYCLIALRQALRGFPEGYHTFSIGLSPAVKQSFSRMLFNNLVLVSVRGYVLTRHVSLLWTSPSIRG